MKRAIACIAAGILLVLYQIPIRAEPADTLHSNCDTAHAKLTIGGFGFLLLGEIVRGQSEWDNAPANTVLLSHYGQNFGDAQLNVTARPNDWLVAKAGLEIQTYLYLQYGQEYAGSYYPTHNVRIPFAEATMHWNAGNAHLFSSLAPAVSSVTVESGLFQYTDNPEAKDLGNYLFRTTATPRFVYTQDDYPWADMQGARAEIGLLNDQVKVDGIVDFNAQYLPFHDLDIAVTASYTPNKIISILGGIDFEHAVKFDGVTPDSIDGIYKEMKDEAVVIFDPKPLFNLQKVTLPGIGKVFNDEDLKIYGEASVLGQNDSALDTNKIDSIPKGNWWHGLPLQRMPILLGFNIPTFRVLDYLSIEVEWWKNPYPDNSIVNGFSEHIDGIAARQYLDNNVKWALSLDKSISKFEFKACAASDHIFYKTFAPQSEGGFEQTLRFHGDWQWWVELRYNL